MQTLWKASMKKQFVTLVSAACLTLAAHPAHASVVVSTLDPTANSPESYSLSQIGQSIIAGSTAIGLTSFDILQSTGFTAGEVFTVYGRTASGMVGTALFNNFSFTHDDATGITSATPNAPFTLSAGAGFFFVLSSSTGDVDWDFTRETTYTAAFGATIPDYHAVLSVDNGATNYYSLDDGPQSFRLNGNAVPEPSTWALASCMLLGGAILLARRRSAGA